MTTLLGKRRSRRAAPRAYTHRGTTVRRRCLRRTSAALPPASLPHSNCLLSPHTLTLAAPGNAKSRTQVDQFSGAVHHGFKTLAEAQSWLATGPQQQEDRGSGGASAGGAGPAATPAPDGTQQSYYARIVAEEVALHAERRRQARETGVLPPDPAAVKAAEEAYERRQAENAAASSAFDALLSEEIGMHRGSRIPASEASGAGAGAAAGRSAVEPEEAARGDGAAGSGSPMGIGGAGAAAAEPAKRKRGRPKKKSADEGDAAASGSSDESSEGAESPEGAAKKKAAKAARAPPKGARKVAAEAAAAVPAAAAAASTNPEHAELPEDLAFALAEAFADDEGERQRKPEGTWLVRFDGGSRSALQTSPVPPPLLVEMCTHPSALESKMCRLVIRDCCSSCTSAQGKSGPRWVRRRHLRRCAARRRRSARRLCWGVCRADNEQCCRVPGVYRRYRRICTAGSATPHRCFTSICSHGVLYGLRSGGQLLLMRCALHVQGLITGLEMALIMGIEDIVVEGGAESRAPSVPSGRPAAPVMRPCLFLLPHQRGLGGSVSPDLYSTVHSSRPVLPMRLLQSSPAAWLN